MPRSAKRARREGGDFEYPFPEKMPVLGPQRIVRKLRLQKLITLNPGVGGVPSVHVYKANGLFDPCVTSGSEQPSGFDQYIADFDSTGLYKFFVVKASKLTAEFMSGDSTNWMTAGITILNDGTVLTEEREYSEAPHTVKTVLGPVGQSNSYRKLVKVADLKRLTGHKDIQDERDMEGKFNADPSNIHYFHVWAAGLGVDTGAIQVRVTIDYVAFFRDINQITMT